MPSFTGHSGAMAFYIPVENISVVETVNQVAHPDISFKTMIKLKSSIEKMNRIVKPIILQKGVFDLL